MGQGLKLARRTHCLGYTLAGLPVSWCAYSAAFCVCQIKHFLEAPTSHVLSIQAGDAYLGPAFVSTAGPGMINRKGTAFAFGLLPLGSSTRHNFDQVSWLHLLYHVFSRHGKRFQKTHTRLPSSTSTASQAYPHVHDTKHQSANWPFGVTLILYHQTAAL